MGLTLSTRTFSLNLSPFLARIVGSNKKYIEFAIPHISSLMVDSLDEVVESAEVVVLTKKSEEVAQNLPDLTSGKKVIDLVRVWDDRRSDGQYEGICW